MSVIEMSCSSCKYLGRTKICSTCESYYLWEESEQSKCQRRLDVAINALKLISEEGINSQMYADNVLEEITGEDYDKSRF